MLSKNSLRKLLTVISIITVLMCVHLKRRIPEKCDQMTTKEFFSRKDIHLDILYFNRVPKTGSENFVALIKKLAERKGFRHVRYRHPDDRAISTSRQRLHVKKIMNMARPLSYDRHIYFINFEDFDFQNPIYFSFVRDPVEKFASRFYYSRDTRGFVFNKLKLANVTYVQNTTFEEWFHKDIEDCILSDDPECQLNLGSEYDLTIPYFCGQALECRILGSDWALTRAMENVIRWYPVVGVLEKFNQSLDVLENTVPKFFSGIADLYFNELKEPHVNKGWLRRPLSFKASEKLKVNLTMETEFYSFIVNRLMRQHELMNC